LKEIIMKTLKLNHELAELVVNGSKRTTFRLFDDKQLSVGDEVQFIDKVDPDDSGTWVTIGTGIIESVSEKRIRAITPFDYEGHEPYKDTNEMIATFQKYYGPTVTEDTPVKIIQFSFKESDNKDVIDVTNTTKLTEVKLFTDGGSRGNPGPSALGFVIMDSKNEIIETGSKYLGITTNNQAEYQAVKAGLEACAKYTSDTVGVYLDSQLVAHQMNGIYKIKNRELWPIHQSIKQISEQKFKKVTFTHVPRELNKDADAMVNEALDSFEDAK
jgi:ribonuclease HI